MCLFGHMQSRNNHRTTDWSNFFEQQLHQIKNCIDASDFPDYDATALFGALSLGAPTYDKKTFVRTSLWPVFRIALLETKSDEKMLAYN